MKVRFFLLGTENYGASQRLALELKQLFSEHITDDGDVMHASSVKDASADIAKAVSDSHALVFISDVKQYAATKLMLAKAFGFEMTADTALLEKACKALDKNPEDEDYEYSVSHAYVGKNSKIFVLGDGLYAGFSVANGNQTIIILPYEKDRTSVLISSQVIPYINATYNTSVSTESLKKYNAQRLYDILDGHNTEVAVAGTNTATFLKEYLSVDERLEGKLHISPIAEKRGNLQPVDYVVNLSITASEFLDCRYSVAISNAFYTGDSPESEKIVYIAVSNERETAVREIHSFEGEEISGFLSRCCGDLCAFISDIIDGDDGFDNDMKTRENAAVKRYKIAIGAVAAVIVAIIVFTVAYFGANGYTFGTWYENFMEWVFPAGDPFKDLFNSGVPGDDETNEDTTVVSADADTEESTGDIEESTDEDETATDSEDETEETDTEADEGEDTSEETFIVG